MRLFGHTDWFDRRLFSPDDGGAGGAAAGGSPPSTPTPAADSSASASPSPSSGTEGTNDGVNDFTGMSVDDFDDLEALPSDAVPQADALAAPASTPAKEPAKAAAPPPAKTPAAAATPPAQQPGPQETPAADAVASPPPAEPAQQQSLVEAMDANRDALIAQIATDMFAMTKEEAEAIETDFTGNLPKLGARVFYQSMKATHNIINTLVPQLIERHLGAIKAREETENAFYGQFTGLEKAKHHADVVQFAKTFRQVNPAVTRDELWSMVAASVAAKHGLTSAQAAQAVASAANGGKPSARPPATEPFAPARPGVTVKTTPEPENAWGGMGRNFDGEDEG